MSLNNEYKILKLEIDEIKASMSEQQETLKKIHQAIVGDKDFGQEGLVELVRKHDKWITAQKFMWAKIYGGIGVCTTLATMVIKFWDKIF